MLLDGTFHKTFERSYKLLLVSCSVSLCTLENELAVRTVSSFDYLVFSEFHRTLSSESLSRDIYILVMVLDGTYWTTELENNKKN